MVGELPGVYESAVPKPSSTSNYSPIEAVESVNRGTYSHKAHKNTQLFLRRKQQDASRVWILGEARTAHTHNTFKYFFFARFYTDITN